MKHRYIKQKLKGTLIFLMAVSLSACGVKEEKDRQGRGQFCRGKYQ